MVVMAVVRSVSDRQLSPVWRRATSPKNRPPWRGLRRTNHTLGSLTRFTTKSLAHTPSQRPYSSRLQDKAQVLADVREIIAEQLGTDLDSVTAESKFVDLGADSLDTVEIMMALEEKFDLQLDEEGAEKISTVQEAADLIAEQCA